MQSQAVEIIEIEGPLVNGEVIKKDGRGPLVSAPHYRATVDDIAFRPRPLRSYNYAEDAPRAGKAIGKGYGTYFKRVVPFDDFHRKLIAGGLVKACGEAKDAPAHIPRAMRLQALDAEKNLPSILEKIPDLEKEAKKAEAALEAEAKKKSPDEKKLADLQAASEIARRRHVGPIHEADAYAKIIAELAELEESHK